MAISSLSLENWKTHIDSTFDFSNGTNVLIGKMGSGKTSVMDAISYSLFGTFPALSNQLLSQVITSRPTKKEQAKLELCFSYSGKNYKIIRIIKPKKTEAYLYLENQLISGPSTQEVNLKIQEIISMTPELFSKAIYSEQNQIDFFLKLPPLQRKQLFDDLLDIQKYETARKNARTILNKFSRLKEQKEKDAENLEKTISLDKEKITSEISEKKSLLPSLEKELSEKYSLYSEKESLFNLLKSKKEKYDSLSKKSTSLKAYISAYSNESFSQSLLEQKQTILTEIIEKEKSLLKEKDIQETLFHSLQSSLLEIQSQIKSFEKESISSFPKQLEGKSLCPLCTQPITEHTKEKLKKDAELFNSQIQEKISLLKKQEQETETKKTKWKENFQSLKTQLSQTQEFKSKLSLEISSLQDSKRKLTLLSDYKKQLEENEISLSSLSFNESEYSKIQEEKYSLSSEVSTLKERKAGLFQLISSYETRLKSMDIYEQQLLSLKQESLFLSTSISSLEAFSLALASTQLEMREHLLDSINQFLDLMWHSLYPYSDYKSLKLFTEKIGLSDSYRLKVLSSEGWLNISNYLSGGEKSIAALALRISFSLVLTKNLSWLILDEPTHNLDSQAISKISELFSTHLPKLVEQIFIITHDKELEKAATSSLYFLDRDKSIDQPTSSQRIL